MGQWYDRFSSENAAVGWLSLDRVPDDLTGFFQYTVAAIEAARPDFGDRVADLLKSAPKPSISALTAAFINDVLDAGEEVFLFIDDFHLATDDAIKALEAILAKPPGNFHLSVATRHSPGFSLSSLRSKGQLVEIEDHWLRFDNQEAAEFLRSAGHETLSSPEIEMLVAMTEGWPAAIQLASISVALARDGREGEALRCLRDAVKKAARPRLIRTFIDEGPVIEALLLKHFQGPQEITGPATSFGLELIRGFAREYGADREKHGAGHKAQEAELLALPEQLNARESEIIKFVSTGMSNKRRLASGWA